MRPPRSPAPAPSAPAAPHRRLPTAALPAAALALLLAACGEAPNAAPIASLLAPAEIVAGTEVQLDGSASTDPDGRVERWEWTIGAMARRGPAPRVTFDAPGDVDIGLVVVDDRGARSAPETVRVRVLEPEPEPEPEPDPTPDAAGFDLEISWIGDEPSETVRSAFDAAASRWEAAIVGDLPEFAPDNAWTPCGRGEDPDARPVDDLRIYVEIYWGDVGGVLGSAGPCRIRGTDGLPIYGFMRLDEADLDSMALEGTLEGVILHEMGHVLGIGTLWEHGRDLVHPEDAACDPNGAAGPHPFLGAGATAEHETLGGTGGPEVEADGGPGTACGHWDEDLYDDELMTGWAGGSMAMSRMTVASLADLGYGVDLEATDAWSLPDEGLLPTAARGEPLGEELLLPIPLPAPTPR